MKIPALPEGSQNVVQTVKEYGKRLFGFIRSRVKTDEDAEDILQDIWYQLTLLESGPVEQLGAWLYRVAQNKIIDRYRKHKTENLEDFAYEDDEGEINFREILLISEDDNPETEYLKKIFWEELFAALAELPEAQSKVFVQNEIDGKTFQEIADETSENVKTLISRKRYAQIYLRSRLSELYQEIVNKN